NYIDIDRDHVVSARPRLDDYKDSGRNRKRMAPLEIWEKCPRATLSELGFQKWSHACGWNGARECRFRSSSACGTNSTKRSTGFGLAGTSRHRLSLAPGAGSRGMRRNRVSACAP